MHTKRSTFDSNLQGLGIDACTTATISGFREDFVGEITPVTKSKLTGVGGSLLIVRKGTFFFRFVDDDRKQRSLKVNDAYYVPRLKLRLFSPQQWSHQEPCYKDGTPVRAESTNRETMTLFFHRGHKIIPHDSKTKLPILYSSTGCEDFSTFAQNAKMATWEARIHPTPETFDKTILVESIFRDSKLKKQIDMELEKIDQEKTEEIPNAQAEGSTKKKKQDLLMKWHY